MRRWLARPSVAVTVVLVLVALLVARLTASAVSKQEEHLLRERGNEVDLVLSASVGSLGDQLDELGTVLRATGGSRSAFETAGAASLADTPGTSVAVLRPTDGGFVVAMTAGPGLAPGQVVTDVRTRTLDRALHAGTLVATGVLGSGAQRAIGFAVGPPVAPPGTVVYRQSSLGPLSPPRAAATAPFSELRVVLYAAPTPVAAQAVVATDGTGARLPLAGRTVALPVTVGTDRWTLQAAASRPLVGPLAARAGWFVAGMGLLVALLVGAVIEAVLRRRDSAIALYDSEHRVAEKLQLGFLPVLPAPEGLDLAAQYLAGSVNQQVGGDWYDVFAIDGGRLGVAIGDVMGHDLDAAVTMSRLQTALRAYAGQGGDPAQVLDTLDQHLRNVQVDRLATLFYGTLGPADEHGGRSFAFANAGHLHPVVRYPDGRVQELVTSRSVVLGVADAFGEVDAPRARCSCPRVRPSGCSPTGLVELSDSSLTASLERLGRVVGAAPEDADADALAKLVVSTMGPGARRDDVAVLVLRIVPADVDSLQRTASGTRRR